MPISTLTIQLFTGFGTQTGWVDVVKMGYPIFWTTFLLGLSGIMIAKQKTEYQSKQNTNNIVKVCSK